MTQSRNALNDLDFMDALLDLVIPPDASGSPPGAGGLGLSSAVTAGIEADPLLGPIVGAGVEAIQAAALSENPQQGLPGMTREAGTQLVETKLSTNPFVMMGLLRYLYPAYYAHPRVLQGIGEPPRAPFPEGFEIEATDARLLEKLQARGRAD